MGFDHTAWGAGDWVAMTSMMLLFWGGLVLLAVWIGRDLRAGRDQQPGSAAGVGRADALLAERFARGDIDAEEFGRSREMLHSAATSSQRAEAGGHA